MPKIAGLILDIALCITAIAVTDILIDRICLPKRKKKGEEVEKKRSKKSKVGKIVA